MMRAFACGLILCATLSAAAEDQLRTLGGKTISGTLAEITAKELTLKTDSGRVATPLAQVLALDVKPVKGVGLGASFTLVRLLDDSLLHCKDFAFKGNDIELTLLSGEQVNVPLSALVWMLRDAQNPALRKKFDDILAQRSRRDRIVILRDMELNPVEGTLGNVDAKGAAITFQREGANPINVLFERLHGLVFYRPEVAAATPLCRVLDSEGNVLVATKLDVKDGSTYTVGTSFGSSVTLKREMLAKLDFNIGKLTFLSDMEPIKVVERSGIGLVSHYRKDANLDGEPILLETLHAKGLSLHAHTELSYDLGGRYKEFKARLGVDTRTGDASQAVVSIYCDSDKRFSETVTAKAPREIALNVKDVTTLKIVVSSHNFLDLHDHATLADARVSQ